LSLLRIVAGFLIMQHGTQKLFGWPAAEPTHPVPLLSLLGVAGLIETFGGLAAGLGLWSRQAAFLLSGEMAVAYFLRHALGGSWPIVNRGELAALYCFIFFLIAAAGGGPWSLDAWLRARRRS
jgi:putative oxidoreductase